MPKYYILLDRARQVTGIRTLEEIRLEFPTAAKEIDTYGYHVGSSYAAAPDMLPPNYFRANGKRYKTIERAIEDNPMLDTVMVGLNDCGTPRVLCVPIKLLDRLRQVHLETLQAKVCKMQAEVDATRRWTGRFEAALEADRKNPSLK